MYIYVPTICTWRSSHLLKHVVHIPRGKIIFYIYISNSRISLHIFTPNSHLSICLRCDYSLHILAAENCAHALSQHLQFIYLSTNTTHRYRLVCAFLTIRSLNISIYTNFRCSPNEFSALISDTSCAGYTLLIYTHNNE